MKLVDHPDTLLQSASEPEQLTSFEMDDTLEQTAKLRTSAHFLRTCGKLSLTTTLLLSPVAATTVNAYDNYTTATSNSASINMLDAPLDEAASTNAVVMFDGLGSNNADRLEGIGYASQKVTDGDLWSIDYGNAPLNPNALADKIAEKMTAGGKNRVTLQGYSAGGSIALEVAESLIRDHHIDVPLITMIMTPNGTDGIVPEQQKLGSMYTDMVSKVPAAAYSDPVRFGGEMIQRRNAYMNQDDSMKKFITTAQHVYKSIQSEDRAAPWLVADQLLAINTMNTDDRLRRIAKEYDMIDPVIAYLRPDEAGSDSLVDNKKSSREICDSAYMHQIDCFIYEVPGVSHGAPGGHAPEAYEATLDEHRDEITDAIARQAAKHAITVHNLTNDAPR